MAPGSSPSSSGFRKGREAAICCTVTRAIWGRSSEKALPVEPVPREEARWNARAAALPPSTGAQARSPRFRLRYSTTHTRAASAAYM